MSKQYGGRVIESLKSHREMAEIQRANYAESGDEMWLRLAERHEAEAERLERLLRNAGVL